MGVLKSEASELSIRDLERLLRDGGRRHISLVRSGYFVPVLGVLLIVKVLAPLDQVVDFVVKVFIMHVHQVLVIERVLIQLLQFLSYFGVDVDSRRGLPTLLLNKLSILSVPVELSKPSDLPESLLSISERPPLARIKVERSLLVVGVCLNLVVRSQVLIVDRSPAVVLTSLIPALVAVLLRLVVLNVDAFLLLVRFDGHVVAGSKGIDVDHRAVHEDLVVDKRRELHASESEPDVALGSRVHQVGFASIDTLQ